MLFKTYKIKNAKKIKNYSIKINNSSLDFMPLYTS